VSRGSEVPGTPGWVRFAINKLLSPTEARLITDELRELHAHWSVRDGRSKADRRYLRQLRQYPLRLFWQRCKLVMAEAAALRFFGQALAGGAQSLVKRPLFTAIGVTTLGLGIGTTTLVFSVVSGVLLEPLPFAEGDALVGVFPLDSENPDQVAAGPDDLAGYYGTDRATYLGWKEANVVFSDMGAFRTPGFTVTGGTRPENLDGAYVDSGVFSTLGTDALLGRVLSAADDAPSAPPVVVLSFGGWQRLLGGDSEAVGRTLSIGGIQHTVIGVMPQDFEFPSELEEIWVNFLDQPNESPNLQVIARLVPELGLERAQQDMDIVAARVGETRPEDDRDWARVVPMRDLVVGSAGDQLLLLFAAVGVVLLVAITNTATLLLVRGSERRRELGVRQAMGAGRGRLVVQMLGESTTLSLAGGAVGCAIAMFGLRPFVALFPDLPRSGELTVDTGILLAAVGLSMLVGLASGLLPAVRWSRVEVTGLLREGGRGSSTGRTGRRLSGSLVVVELAMAFMLLHGAGLFVRSFQSVASVDVGFQAAGVVTTRLRLPAEYRSSNEDIESFYEELLSRIASIPGTESVGAASQMPFTTGVSSADLRFDNAAGPVETTEHIVFATPGFLPTLGFAVRSGRGFTWDDREGTESVALINRALAERYFPGEDPIGRAIGITWDEPWTHTVVGVVDDVRYRLEGSPFPAIYVPFAQRPTWYQSIVIRTSGDAAALSTALRETVWTMDPTMPVDIAHLDDVIAGSRTMRARRFSTTVVGWLAGVATLLALIGVYGVLASVVNQRRRDIGIRMTLGATSHGILALVLRDAAVLGALGLIVGLALSLGLSQFISSQLHGVSATDPATLATVALMLSGAVLLASYVPARRASAVEPVRSLD